MFYFRNSRSRTKSHKRNGMLLRVFFKLFATDSICEVYKYDTAYVLLLISKYFKITDDLQVQKAEK